MAARWRPPNTMVRETEEEPKEDGAWSLWSGEAPLSWTCELLPPAHVQRIQLPSPPLAPLQPLISAKKPPRSPRFAPLSAPKTASNAAASCLVSFPHIQPLNRSLLAAPRRQKGSIVQHNQHKWSHGAAECWLGVHQVSLGLPSGTNTKDQVPSTLYGKAQ